MEAPSLRENSSEGSVSNIFNVVGVGSALLAKGCATAS